MGGHDKGKALVSKLFDHLHYPILVAIVQVGGRLIQQDQLGLLGDHPGYGHLLPFSTRDLRIGFVA